MISRVFFSTLIFGIFLATEQLQAAPLTNISLFQDASLLEVRLQGDLSAITDLNSDPFHPVRKSGQLQMLVNGNWQAIDLDFENRGGYGRGVQCSFKPIKLVLTSSSQVQGTLFDHIKDDEIKLVTHCMGGGVVPVLDKSNQEVFYEYLLYKTLEVSGLDNLLTRLAHVVYLDVSGTVVADAYGFFVEPIKDHAKMRGWRAAPISDHASLSDQVPIDVKTRFDFSEALVENWDYHIELGHNSRILVDSGGNIRSVLLYDFDRSQIVQTLGSMNGSGARYLSQAKYYGTEMESAMRKIALQIVPNRAATMDLFKAMSGWIDTQSYQTNILDLFDQLEHF